MGILQSEAVNSTGIAPICSVKTKGFVGRLTHPANAQPIKTVKRIFNVFTNEALQASRTLSRIAVIYSIPASFTPLLCYEIKNTLY